MGEYLLSNAADAAATRLAVLGEIFDPWTFRHLDRLGLARDWRCWEVGAGGSSVVRGLAERVGPEGHVLATDIDVSRIGALGPPVEVRRHDVARDPPPEGAFDLVHARLVLVHLTDRAAALRAMVGVLRPGGWLLVEDADPALQPLACPDATGPDEELANQLRTRFRALLAERGADLAYGRTLPRLLRASGLADVGAEVYAPLALPSLAPLELATIEMVRDGLVAAGATPDEIERHRASVASGRIDVTTAPMISAWGRRQG